MQTFAKVSQNGQSNLDFSYKNYNNILVIILISQMWAMFPCSQRLFWKRTDIMQIKFYLLILDQNVRIYHSQTVEIMKQQY